MLRAITPVLDFRDPVSLSPTDPTAHGLGLDRLTFLLRGYRDGAEACHALTMDDLDAHPRPGRHDRRHHAAPVRLDRGGARRRDRVGRGLRRFRPAACRARRSLPDPAELAAAQPYGQFAAATAAALAAGREITETDSGAACFAGAWVASVFGKTDAGQLGSWPGDADEALDLIRTRPGATFEQVAAFADGFHTGAGGCR